MDVKGPAGLVLSIEDKPYHPGFGVEHIVKRLAVSWQGRLPLALNWNIS